MTNSISSPVTPTLHPIFSKRPAITVGLHPIAKTQPAT